MHAIHLVITNLLLVSVIALFMFVVSNESTEPYVNTPIEAKCAYTGDNSVLRDMVNSNRLKVFKTVKDYAGSFNDTGLCYLDNDPNGLTDPYFTQGNTCSNSGALQGTNPRSTSLPLTTHVFPSQKCVFNPSGGITDPSQGIPSQPQHPDPQATTDLGLSGCWNNTWTFVMDANGNGRGRDNTNVRSDVVITKLDANRYTFFHADVNQNIIGTPRESSTQGAMFIDFDNKTTWARDGECKKNTNLSGCWGTWLFTVNSSGSGIAHDNSMERKDMTIVRTSESALKYSFYVPEWSRFIFGTAREPSPDGAMFIDFDDNTTWNRGGDCMNVKNLRIVGCWGSWSFTVDENGNGVAKDNGMQRKDMPITRQEDPNKYNFFFPEGNANLIGTAREPSVDGAMFIDFDNNTTWNRGSKTDCVDVKNLRLSGCWNHSWNLTIDMNGNGNGHDTSNYRSDVTITSVGDYRYNFYHIDQNINVIGVPREASIDGAMYIDFENSTIWTRTPC